MYQAGRSKKPEPGEVCLWQMVFVEMGRELEGSLVLRSNCSASLVDLFTV